MIEKSTLEAVHRSGLPYKSITIGTQGGSLINEVVGTLNSTGLLVTNETPEDWHDIERSEVVEDGVTHYRASHKEIYERINSIQDHTVLMKEAKDIIVGSIRSISDIVKNTVNPHIRRVIGYLEDERSEMLGTGGYTIKEISLHPVLSTERVQALITRFDKSMVVHQGDKLFKELHHGEPSNHVELTEELNLDSGIYYSGIKDALSGDSDYLNKSIQVRAYLAVFLAGLEMPSPGIKTTLDKWTSEKAVVLNALVHSLIKDIERYTVAQNTNNLYGVAKTANTYDSKAFSGIREICVHSGVYREIIRQGATPEAVIGNELLNRKYTARLLINPEVITICERAFKLDQESNKKALAKSNNVAKWRNIEHALTQDLRNVAEKEEWPVAGDSIEKAENRLRTVLSKVRASTAHDASMDDIIAAVICTTWYGHTDAWRLIDIAGRNLREDPELSSDEAYTLAKIEYLALYLSSTLSVGGPVEKM